MTNKSERLIHNLKDSKKWGIPLGFRIVIYIVLAIAIINAVRTRSFWDFINPTLFITCPISFTLLIIYLSNIRKSVIAKPSKKKLIITICIITLLIPFTGLIYYSAFVSIKDLFVLLWFSPLTKNNLIIWMPILALMFGIGLFCFRLKFRAIYGLSEALTGLAVAINRVESQMEPFTSTAFYLAILTASVYLIVRGFDNIHQGLTKEPVDPYGQKLYKILIRKI